MCNASRDLCVHPSHWCGVMDTHRPCNGIINWVSFIDKREGKETGTGGSARVVPKARRRRGDYTYWCQIGGR